MACSCLLMTFHQEGHWSVTADSITKSVEMRKVNKKKRHFKKVNSFIQAVPAENHEHDLFSIQIDLWVYFVRQFGHSPNEIRL